eukprot:1155748-Pelagomonas_calceolata.AAC.3
MAGSSNLSTPNLQHDGLCCRITSKSAILINDSEHAYQGDPSIVAPPIINIPSATLVILITRCFITEEHSGPKKDPSCHFGPLCHVAKPSLVNLHVRSTHCAFPSVSSPESFDFATSWLKSEGGHHSVGLPEAISQELQRFPKPSFVNAKGAFFLINDCYGRFQESASGERAIYFGSASLMLVFAGNYFGSYKLCIFNVMCVQEQSPGAKGTFQAVSAHLVAARPPIGSIPSPVLLNFLFVRVLVVSLVNDFETRFWPETEKP